MKLTAARRVFDACQCSQSFLFDDKRPYATEVLPDVGESLIPPLELLFEYNSLGIALSDNLEGLLPGIQKANEVNVHFIWELQTDNASGI